MPYKKVPQTAGQIDTGPFTGPFSRFRNRMPDLFISTGIHDHLQRVFGAFQRSYERFRGFTSLQELISFSGIY